MPALPRGSEVIAMPVYICDSSQLEPPPERERTPAEWMDECSHHCVCWRLYARFVDGEGREGCPEDMARALGCDECGEWDG